MSNHGDYLYGNGPKDGLNAMAANDDLNDGFRARSPAEALEPARAPEPPSGRKRRRTHPFLMLINGAMTLAVVAFLGFLGLVYYGKKQFDAPGPLTHSTVFVIPKGEGLRAIAERLERESIISDRITFVGSAYYFSVQGDLKAGEYEIRKHASMRDVLDKLVEGRAVLHKVSIPEGLTSEQVVARLNGHEMLKGEIKAIPAEGSLLPDTYKFSRHMTRQDLIDRMQAEQQKFVTRLWKSRKAGLPISTPQEAIILASIVEKETGRADERARIAGVFVNRLNKGMPLQSDPTVIYGLVGGKGKLGRGILRSELQRETPYNTYKVRGLTPTPIANPGRAAIEAVLNPAETTDLFFVADGTGGHAFAPTLAKHNQNVAVWRRVERERREKAEAEAKAKALAAANASAGEQAPAGTPGAVQVPAGTPQQPGQAATNPAVSGLAAESAPGGVDNSVLEGLNIRLPQPGDPAAVPTAPPAVAPPAAAPIASAPAAPAPSTAAAANVGTAASIPLPKRKPGR